MNDTLSSVAPEKCLYADPLDGDNFMLKPVVQVFNIDFFLKRLFVHNGKKVYEVQYSTRLPKISLYSVVRFDEYSISVSEREHSITVNKLTILRDGTEIEQNIPSGQDWSKVGKSWPNQTKLLLKKLDLIAFLDPESGREWTIEAKVVSKIPIQSHRSSELPERYFKVDLRDISGEIRMAFFNDMCDWYFDTIQSGKTYRISRGKLQPSYKYFNNLNHAYEITVTRSTIIEESSNEDPGPLFSDCEYLNFEQVKAIANNSLVNTIGVVEDISKSGSRVIFRYIDSTGIKLFVALYREAAATFDAKVGQIVAFQGIRTNQVNKRFELVSGMDTRFEIDPDIPEATSLHTWYQQNVCHKISQNGKQIKVSKKNMIASLIELTPNSSEANEDQCQSMEVLATIISIQLESHHFFKACANSECGRKSVEITPGVYWCPICGCSSENFRWNLVARIQLADATRSVWVSAPKRHMEQLLARSIDFMLELMSSHPSEFRKLVTSSLFQTYRFSLVSSEEGIFINEISSGNSLWNLMMKSIDYLST